MNGGRTPGGSRTRDCSSRPQSWRLTSVAPSTAPADGRSPPTASAARPRARRVRVTVDGDGAVLVTLPRRAPERAAAEAVRELAPWIARRRRVLARAAAEVARPAGHGALPRRDADAAARARAARACTAAATCCSSPRATRRPALERFYRRAARAEIAPRLDAADRPRRHALRAA